MTMPLGSATVTLGVTGTFNTPSTGIKGLIIGNESPYTLDVRVGSNVHKTLYPETVDFFGVPSGYNGNVTFIPQGILTNPTSYTASTISFDAVGLNENFDASVFPLALTRPAVNPTATGAPIYTATWEVRSTAGVNQNLAVFNPANSGTILTFHSAKVLTNDSTLPTSNLIYWNSDPNLANAVNAVSHSGWNTLTNSGFTQSVAHCTADDDANNFFFANRVTDIQDMPANVVLDALTFPDVVTLNPGVALILTLYSGTNAHTIRLTLKWSEKVQVPPLIVQGAKAVASSIQNDGSPLATQWLEITPTGFGSSSIISTVDGQLTWNVVRSGVYHQILKAVSVGSDPLQLGQLGDIVDLLGTMLLQGGFSLSGKHPATLAGGTSGTADLYELFTGGIIVDIVRTNNFRTAAGAQSIVLPTAFADTVFVNGFDLEPVQFMKAGVSQGNRQVSAFSAVAGSPNTTIAGSTTGIQFHNIIWFATGFDTLQFNGGWGAAHTGVLLIIGH